jgi:predicted ATPase with chaperone activity
LKQGEKISKLENASQNLIHLPLTILQKDFEKDLQKEFAKTNLVVQAWSKILKIKRKPFMHIL